MAKAHCTDDGRVCTICGEFKRWSCFGALKLGERGKASHCLDCSKWYGRIRRAKTEQERDSLKRHLAELKTSATKVIKSINMSSPTSTCSWCKLELPRSMFGADKTTLNGLKAYCRKCKALESRRYRTRNPDVAAESTRSWAARNPEKVEEKRKRWMERNPGRQTELARRWREENAERNRANWKSYVSQPHVKIHRSVASRLRKYIDKESKSTFSILGYSRDELISHIEKQFTKGMTWGNYGEWQIDHIIPLSAFEINDASDPDLRIAWCLSNLRPIWAAENLAKRDKRIFLV